MGSSRMVPARQALVEGQVENDGDSQGRAASGGSQGPFLEHLGRAGVPKPSSTGSMS